MTICELCNNRIYPETAKVSPGQNIQCKKGLQKNMEEYGYASNWVFQQKKCKYADLKV
jgi:hypothetical protein